MTQEELIATVEDRVTATGMGSAVLGRADFVELVGGTVGDMLGAADHWLPGTVVGRRRDSVHRRSLLDPWPHP